ncbi:retrovirus-related pol polyprotein from transposon TNT 1-94 [Tanacetum coccineum]
MMKPSLICLLSKASKSKSWLWHRRLNHLNFGTINDLARKDLVRGLPRLKFEKDHLCSACQLGKSKSRVLKGRNTNMEVLHTLHMDLKHDSDDDEDDDDDEGPSAGSNQGKSAKRRRYDSGASGSAQPPPKNDEQSSKKPHDSDASASKQHPTLTSTGWQITDTRDVVIDSSRHSSEPESAYLISGGH